MHVSIAGKNRQENQLKDVVLSKRFHDQRADYQLRVPALDEGRNNYRIIVCSMVVRLFAS